MGALNLKVKSVMGTRLYDVAWLMYIYSLSLFLLPFLAWVPPPRIHKRSLNVVTLCIWWFDQHLFHPGLSSSNWAEVVEQLRESTKLKGKKLLLPVRLALTGQWCLTCCTGLGCSGTAIYNSKSASGIFWDRDRYWTATVVWCGDPGCNCLIPWQDNWGDIPCQNLGSTLRRVRCCESVSVLGILQLLTKSVFSKCNSISRVNELLFRLSTEQI